MSGGMRNAIGFSLSMTIVIWLMVGFVYTLFTYHLIALLALPVFIGGGVIIVAALFNWANR